MARMVQKEMRVRVLVGKPKVKGPLDDLDRDAQEILKWISKKYCERSWTGLMWFRIRIREVLLCTW